MRFSVYAKYTDNTNVFPDVHQATLVNEQRASLFWGSPLYIKGVSMKTVEKNGIYFITGIKEIVVSVGGQFNDTKERPVVTLL